MWRYVVRFSSIAATLLSAYWFYAERSFEPAVALLVGISGVVSSFMRRRDTTASALTQPIEQQQSSIVYRSEIERALDNLVSFEEGTIFQTLAVILAKKRWPKLIASERKWDHGLDAHALPDMGLASSLTPALSKIKDDARRARAGFANLKTLIFYTPAKITNHTALIWAKELADEFNLKLIVVSREDLIASLMDPANAALCRTHLGLPVPLPEAVRDCLAAAMEACAETTDNWFRHMHLCDHPLIQLNLARIHEADEVAPEAIALDGIQHELGHGRRLIMKAPPGAGKTTTLLQLAEKIKGAKGICIIVDLPSWINSGSDLIELVTQSPAFRSRSLNAESLTRLFRTEHVDFLLNGWNEIEETYSGAAAQTLRKMERDYPDAGILLATRAHGLEPPLPGAWQVTIRDLTVEQRRTYLSQSLEGRFSDLLSQITANPTLDALTRTPLILAEVVKLFESGRPIPATKLDILDAMSQRIQGSEEHRIPLEVPPLSGRAKSYLSALAFRMTDLGRVDLSDEEARATLARESAALQEAGQLVAAHEPRSIVTALCAHHVLQRLDYPEVNFRFQHQQFQEFYAALRILEPLKLLSGQGDGALARNFQIKYVDRPVWEEALTMVADAVGGGSTVFGPHLDPIAMGEHLIRCAIPVDPVFAAELAQKCGEIVWSRIGAEFGALLRRWYAVDDSHHQRCALAAMLATGSSDFLDVILPLLTNADQQIRLRSYRAFDEFHLSSLGPDWRSVVAGWSEEQRANFVGEVLWDAGRAAITEEFATSDSSHRVRMAAIDALRWMGAEAILARVQETLHGPDLIDATSHGADVNLLSESARARLLSTLRERADSAGSPSDRLRALFRLAELKDARAPEDLRATLAALTEADLRGIDDQFLVAALKAVRASYEGWANTWISVQIAGGVLWADKWMPLVGAVPPDLVEQILTRISSEETDYHRLQSAIGLIAKAANLDLAKRIWQRFFEFSASTAGNSEGGPQSLGPVLRRQLEELICGLPAPLCVSGAIESLSSTPDLEKIRAVLKVFGGAAEEGDLRTELPEQLRRLLRDILARAIPSVLKQEDFSGSMKASLALALARAGGPEDAGEVKRIIRADIERIRSGSEARGRGDRGPRANGASMSWSNWYVKALSWLGADVAEPILVELLEEPEYEGHAAAALTTLALPNLKPRLGLLTLERQVGPDAQVSAAIDETRRGRYAKAIIARITALLERYEESERKEPLTIRIKALGCVLARLDGRNSVDFILQVMALPGTWDGWKRVEALEGLLLRQSRLPTDPTLAVLEPTIEHTISQDLFDDHNAYLLMRCLRVLSFVDNAARGIGRIREILTSARFPSYHLRELVGALARSASEEALDLLVELARATNISFQHFTMEWIKAVGAMDLPRARAVLMGIIDPSVAARVAISPEFHDSVAEQLATIAEKHAEIRTQVSEICGMQLSPVQRQIVSGVVAKLGDSATVLAGLNLIHDDASPRIPFHIARAIESVVFERRRYTDSASIYSLVPRIGANVRERLFAYLMDDPSRRRSAFSLLGEIEDRRLDFGSPPFEPRHPAIGSGVPWPPLDIADATERDER